MRAAKHMSNEELAHQLRHFFKHPPSEGLGFVRAFIGKVKKGWPVTDKMRFKAERMVDESYAESEPLVEPDDA